MIEAVLVGGGGHAMSCLDAADPTRLRFVGWVGAPSDDGPPIPHLGDDDTLPALLRSGIGTVFVAVGDNRRRANITTRVEALGFDLATLLAASARVSRWAVVSSGAAVLHGALVGPRTHVGRGAIVNTAASVDHDCHVGDFAHVAPGGHLAGGVELGDHVFAGVGVSIIPKVKVGPGTVLGAGSVVVDDVPADVVSFGVPARTRRRG